MSSTINVISEHRLIMVLFKIKQSLILKIIFTFINAAFEKTAIHSPLKTLHHA
jgi:hypothetical protein